MQIVSAGFQQPAAFLNFQDWSTDFQRPGDLFASGARSFEHRHGVGIAELVREVFESPTGTSAGKDGKWAALMAVRAFSQMLLTDRGPDLMSLSAADYDPIPPRREFRISVQISYLGRPPALPIEC
jgi:hypothetical protein